MESRDGAFVRSRSAKLGSSRASRENRTAVRFAATDVDAEAGVRKPSTGLLTFIRDYSRGHLVPAHRHSCAQLLYASSGLVRVETSRRSWVLAPHLAILVPAEFTHETHMLTDVKLSSFHTEHLSQWSTRDCMVIEVTPLLRELITALTAGRPVAGSSRRLALIHELLEEELRMARGAGWAIPMPQEPRLQIFCRRVIDEPSAHATLDAVASSVGLGAKTVARLFEQEFGMCFRQWRETAYFAIAGAHLAQGMSVKAVAGRLGYTPSAFSVMMRRHSGTAPRAIREMRQHSCAS